MRSQRAVIGVGLGFVLAACEQPVPFCDSENVKKLVIKNAYVSSFALDLLRLQEPELFKSVVKGTLEHIRERRVDKKAGKRWCVGHLRLQIDDANLPEGRGSIEFVQAIKAIELVTGGIGDQNYTVQRTSKGQALVVVGE